MICSIYFSIHLHNPELSQHAKTPARPSQSPQNYARVILTAKTIFIFRSQHLQLQEKVFDMKIDFNL